MPACTGACGRSEGKCELRMELNERQYERVGRRLDGEQIDLTPDELNAAAEIRRMETLLSAMLHAPDSRMAIERARRKMLGELGRPKWRTRWVLVPAAAAAILVAITAIWLWPRDTNVPPPPVAGDEVAEIYAHLDENVDLDLIGEELQALEAEMIVSVPAATLDAELQDLEETLDTFWLEEAPIWVDDEG